MAAIGYKKIIIAVIILAILGVAWRLFGSPRWIPTKDSRTLYAGSVKIEPLTLLDIKERLEKQGCHTFIPDDPNVGCRYQEITTTQTKEKGIEIFPRGPGWGPLSFTVTETTLYATKDIPGRPDFKKFKAEVREDVVAIGRIFTLQEDSWGKIKTTYPWDVLY